MKFHLSEDGEPRVCRAQNHKCPYGDSEHYTSAEIARKAFEKSQSTFPVAHKSLSHEMKLSEETNELLDSLYSVGFTPYLVGGSVRDSFLSSAEAKDVDIEVFGVETIEELEKQLRKSGYNIDAVGKSFGVLKTQLKNGEDIDISMPRRDNKIDGGHLGFDVQVDPTLSLADAAGRRDFTINALYYSPTEKKIVDPYEGVLDYRAGVLKHINEHFGEDPLRVLRGVQFAARFKMNLHETTAELCRDLKKEFDTISPERFQTEFEKMFTKGDIQWGLRALKDTGWDEKFGLQAINPRWGSEVQKTIDRAKSLNEDSALYGASKLLKAINPSNSEHAARAFLAGDKRQKKALHLMYPQKPADMSEKSLNAWTRQIWRKKQVTAKDYFIMNGDEKLRKETEKLGIFTKPNPDLVTGEMVLKLSDKKPGPWVGEILKKANQAQDDAIFTTTQDAEEWLQKTGRELLSTSNDTSQRTTRK